MFKKILFSFFWELASLYCYQRRYVLQFQYFKNYWKLFCGLTCYLYWKIFHVPCKEYVSCLCIFQLGLVVYYVLKSAIYFFIALLMISYISESSILKSPTTVAVVYLPSHVQFSATPWTVAHRAPLFMKFFSPFPSPGDLLNSGIKFMTPALAGGFFTTESLWKPQYS